MKRTPLLKTAISSPRLRHRRPPLRATRRQGVSVLLVVLLVSITLGLSYAAVRSRTTALQIQRNSDRRALAHQAAITGLTLALKKMHTATSEDGQIPWEGVETTLTGTLGSHESFRVFYNTGDPSLSPAHPDYADYPFRVTLHSTGYAADPVDPSRVATHNAQAVLRLVPRNLAAQPTDWATMQQYTVYQSHNDFFEFDVPCRLEGPIRVQGKAKIAMHYPNKNGAWSRYLGDLNAIRLDGQPDYRPLTGPVDLSHTQQDGVDLSVLTTELAVTVNNTPLSPAAADWTKPIALTSYQVYPGGPVYEIPPVGSTLQNVTLGPDPQTNPLGIYYRAGSVAINDNVTIRGSLFCHDNIDVAGTNVHFTPLRLPALHGSLVPVRLPVASCQNFTVKATAGGSLTGLLAVFDAYQVDESLDTVSFHITGRLITRKFFIKERHPWEIQDWPALYANFLAQLDGSQGPPVPYFPLWLDQHGRDPKPLLTVKPDPLPIRYHWNNLQKQIYLPHPNDDGLRWDLVRWTDNL